MENPSTPLTPTPRDSRLEQFATTARNIIAIERGLTATALVKIRYLAKQQHLSHEQVETCLSQISGDDSSLGRVGRYEQLFLDRMETDLSVISNAEASGVLSPTIQRQAIQIAVDEYQINESRANQLLSFSAKQHGLRQVSTADAKSKLRDWIAERLSSREFEPADLKNQISGLAQRFGISDADVDQLMEAEIAARQKQQWLRNRWLFCGVLALACIFFASYLFGRTFLFTPTSDVPTILETTKPEPDPITTNKERISSANADTTVEQNSAGDFDFRAEDFELPSDDDSVKALTQWQQQLIKIAKQPIGNWDHKPQPDSLANLRKKNQAFAKLQSEDADSRAQIRGLEDLSKLTESLTDITAAEANLLARFCLQTNSADLQLAIQRKVDRLARWPRFLLAISDQWAESNSNQRPESKLWQQRIGFFLTKASPTNQAKLEDLIFAKAKLRLAEISSTQPQRNIQDSRTQAAKTLANHIRQFVLAELPNSPQQRYFLRLIDHRDRHAVSMQQRVELQQILIESILFTSSDDQLSEIADAYYQSLQKNKDLSEQLDDSRRTMLELVSKYVIWREKNLGQNALTETDPQPQAALPLVKLEEAQRLRDRAELAVIAGDESKRKLAEADYLAAASYGDAKIARSCLRGLIGIAKDPRTRQRYVRQLDFINEGQMGPIANSAANSDQRNLTVPTTVILAIIKICQNIRQDKSLDSQAIEFLNGTTENPSRVIEEIGQILHTISQKPKPLSTLELYRIVQIEAMAKSARAGEDRLRIDFDLSRDAQTSLRPRSIIPLLPR